MELIKVEKYLILPQYPPLNWYKNSLSDACWTRRLPGSGNLELMMRNSPADKQKKRSSLRVISSSSQSDGKLQ